jgi:hypothetical protein
MGFPKIGARLFRLPFPPFRRPQLNLSFCAWNSQSNKTANNHNHDQQNGRNEANQHPKTKSWCHILVQEGHFIAHYAKEERGWGMKWKENCWKLGNKRICSFFKSILGMENVDINQKCVGFVPKF